MPQNPRSLSPYSKNRIGARTPRATEYELFSRISHRLRRAAENRATDFPAFASAVHENRRVWTALASEVADPRNALPADLRARIFYLSRFSDAHSRKLLQGEGDPGVLLDINAAILAGLSDRVAA